MAVISSLSEGAIIGLAVAGGTAALLVLVTTGLHFQKRRNQNKTETFLSLEAQPLEAKELAAFLRSERPRDDYIPNSLNAVPSLPPHRRLGSMYIDTVVPPDILDDDLPMTRANTKRLSPTRVLSRVSTGIRDSWPLTNPGHMPNALHGLARLQSQSQSTITLNQVAPPGYLVTSDPKYPNRTYSRSSKTRVLKDVAGHQRLSQPASTHSSQLTTILRSTSERLRPSQSRRKSLSRTLTSFTRPGPPPIERPSSPNKTIRVKESCEALIDKNSEISIASSFSDEQLLQTPSPEKNVERIAGRLGSAQSILPSSPSVVNGGLCNMDLEYHATRTRLSSENKQCRSKQRRDVTGVSPVRMSPVESKDYPCLPKRGIRVSAQASDHTTSRVLGPEINDPFFLNSKSAKLVSTKDQPRPLFIRKSKDSIPHQLPLKDISGNSQTPTKRDSVSSTFTTQQNTSRRSPLEPSHTSPRPSQRIKNGHKRSKTVRISVLPAAPSSVSMVPEESEESDDEQSPFRYHVPSPSVGVNKQPKSPSPSPSPSRGRSLLQRRQQKIVSSMSVFDPYIHIPPKMPLGRTINSPFGDVQIYSPTMPSPTRSSPARISQVHISPRRISSIAGNDSKGNFFHDSRLSLNTTYSRRECSVAPITSPTTLLDEIMGFPRPPTTAHSWQSEQSINFAPASFSVLPTTRPILVQTPANLCSPLPLQGKSPALSPNSEILRALENHKVPQPVLTLPFIPGHLTGPRDLPPKYESPTRSSTVSMSLSPSPSRAQTQRIPQKDSLHQSICMLRRMNSDISGYESPTSSYSQTETAASPGSSLRQTNIRQRTPKHESGSSYYHKIHNSDNYRQSGTPSNSKHRVLKHSSNGGYGISRFVPSKQLASERAISVGNNLSDLELENIVDAIPVDSSIMVSSSPTTEPENDFLPTESELSSQIRAGTVEYSSPDLTIVGGDDREEILELESPIRIQKWSDNIPKPDYHFQFPKLEPPATWNSIVLPPTRRESRENSLPSQLGLRNSFIKSSDGPSIRSSVINKNDRRSVRKSDINVEEFILRNVISKERDETRKQTCHSPSDRASFNNKIRKKPTTMWSHWNDSPRDSLYDSDGFLKSSPARLSTCL